MFTIENAKVKFIAFFKSRGFVAVMLSVVCAFAVITVAGNTKKVTVQDGEESVTVLTMKTGTDEILAQVGVELQEHDKVEVTEESATTMELQVKRAIQVSVNADGRTQDVILYEGRVNDAFAAAGVEVKDLDVCNLSLNEPLSTGMEISLDRVEYRDVTTTQEVPFAEVKKNSNTLLKGKTKVSQQGVVGERTIVTREKLVNGQVVSSEVVSDQVTRNPVDKITLIGTKVEEVKPLNTASKKWSATVKDGVLIDHTGKEVAYRSYIDGKATAYTAGNGINGGYGTSTGRKLEYGMVAVNPNIIPYGTRLYICSADGKTVYGYGVAGDTGGGVMAGKILVDLYFNSLSECANFGFRNMRVYILQ